MKKKERDHLKDDPFLHFIERSLLWIKTNKKNILSMAGLALIVILAVVLFFYFKGQSIANENRLTSEVLTIKASAAFGMDEKIEKLEKWQQKNGRHGFDELILARLYFEKGDLEKAAELLEKSQDMDSKLLNDQKKLLLVEVLISTNREQKALDILNEMINDQKLEVAKDYLLLKAATLKIKLNQTKAAKSDLDRIMEEFPQSMYMNEVQKLLESLNN